VWELHSAAGGGGAIDIRLILIALSPLVVECGSCI